MVYLPCYFTCNMFWLISS